MFYVPFLTGIYYSLTRWNEIAKEPVFIGFENYKTLFNGISGFLTSIGFTMRYTILFMLLANVLALAIAAALTKKFKGVGIIRSMFFIPYIMSMTIVGAGSFKKFFMVTLPLLKPSIVTCIFLSLTNSLKVFDIILALTKGGPGDATYSATMDIYREAFQRNNYGLGSAKAIVFFLLVLVITQAVMKIMDREERDTVKKRKGRTA